MTKFEKLIIIIKRVLISDDSNYFEGVPTITILFNTLKNKITTVKFESVPT